MNIRSFVFNPFEENTLILYDDTGDCIIVDPGCYEPPEVAELTGFIDSSRLRVTKIVNTHCHVDHVLGNYALRERYKVPLLIHRAEEPVLKAATILAPHYGLVSYTEALPDGYLAEGDTVDFGKQALKVLFVPGHSPGHIALYNASAKALIGGDVLFYNSIGRTDLPGGNHRQLIDSIHTKLFTLPDDTTVYPGHGPETTIGFEKRTNPFCAIIQAG